MCRKKHVIPYEPLQKENKQHAQAKIKTLTSCAVIAQLVSVFIFVPWIV